jgi:hypothetical protein
MSIEKTESNPEGFPLFRSTTGEPVLVCLTAGGHSISVTPDEAGTPLHPRFHRAAIMRACVPLSAEGLNLNAPAPKKTVEKDDLILAEIEKLVEQSDGNPDLLKDWFTNDGKPNASLIASRIGLPVTAADRDRVWATFEKGVDD